MKEYTKTFAGFVASVLLIAASGVANAQQQVTQDQGSPQQSVDYNRGTKVAPGQQVNIEGVILKRDQSSLVVRDNHGGDYLVTLSGNTEIKEKKSNPFRGARTYSTQQLLQGMTVQVSGRGDNSGSIAASRIRFTSSDLRVAEAVDTRVSPVELNLNQATTRLGQAEQNAQRMSGQLEELSSVANAARGGARAAQDTADGAQEAASRANAGVDAANTRISNIDDYQVVNTSVVKFKVGSDVLSKEAQEELDKIAEDAKNQKGFVIEVSGFASAEGSQALNQRLSQRRADQVIRYLAENYDIPLRRFITPIGLGITHPIADNKTRAGREENRRVEIKILTSKGLAQPGTGGPNTTGSPQK